VSGGDQAELRAVFAKRGLADWFNGGIFGSPRNKEEILASEIDAGLILPPALLFGDSKYDYHAAISAGLDFIFISAWSEVDDWEEWVSVNCINHQPFISTQPNK
jgi:phosphoglycolate phosphatase-like HAD superfamily hydrolase